MKILSFVITLSFFFVSNSFAQKSETIPVSGNCGMCKNTIEKAAKSAGATTATWDKNTKKLNVTYSASTNAEKIQKAVAAAGYDTRDFKANDAAYEKLPSCCHYDRSGNASKADAKHDNHEAHDASKCTKENCKECGDHAKTASCCADGKCTDKCEKVDGKCKDMAACKDKSCCKS
ncbi:MULTISPECIES: heavy-metal-associated domain-containing protein [unclassified Paraflavitalea]|uniref:heavy-metal-associated domain-containing protein n=1 Tax=unclassified Paraflavitalea TaxID=2798305 RepID=UPI003D33D43A